MKLTTDTIFLGGAALTVALAIVAGLLALGSPGEERALRLDDRRVADMQGIMAAADLYWTRHGTLPVSLQELSSEPGVQIRTADPVTSEMYGYELADSAEYRLCATFDRESREIARGPEGDLWSHGPGRQCFELEAQEIERNER